MATAKKIQKKEKLITETENLIRLIPASLQTRAKSAMFVKELMGVAISSILYYRDILDDSYFTEKPLDTHNVKVLKCQTNSPFANRIVNLIFAAHEAIDLGYLRQFIFIVKDGDQMLEKHTFTLEYSDKYYKKVIAEHINDKMNEKKFIIDEIKNQSKLLIFSIVQVMSQVTTLPSKPDIYLRLTYNDTAPENYHPKYFEPINYDVDDTCDVKSIQLGLVTTPFHMLNVKTKILTDSPWSNVATVGTEAKTEPLSEVNKRLGVGESSKMANNDHTTQQRLSQNMSFSSEDPNINHTLLSRISVRCPCHSTVIFGLMIQCNICKKCQHGYCFAIIDEKNIPNPHTCDICAAEYGLEKATALELNEMSIQDRREHCLKLFALGLCLESNGNIMIETFMDTLSISREFADNIIDEFIRLKVLVKKMKGYAVSKRMIKKTIIPMYFTDRLEKISAVSNKAAIAVQL